MGENFGESLALLEEMGVTLPAPAYWIGILLFGVIGIVVFWQGRKRKKQGVKWTGLALMLYPYLVWGTLPLYIVGIVLCGVALWYWRKA